MCTEEKTVFCIGEPHNGHCRN